jgi:peptidoglycan-associated lipoprotein
MKKFFSVGFVLLIQLVVHNGCANRQTVDMNNPNLNPDGTSKVIVYEDNMINPYNGTFVMGGDTNGTNSAFNSSAGSLSIESIYFDIDRYGIRADMIPVMATNTQKSLYEISNGAKLKLEGNCDASGSDEYNYALGIKRANSVKDELVNQGINADTISVVSLGESNPKCTTAISTECYAKNRRVDFQLIK